MESKYKYLNIIFRLVIFACAVASVLSCVNVIAAILSVEDEITEDIINQMYFGMKCYNTAFIGTGIALVMSIVSYKSERLAAVIARSVFVGGLLIMYFKSMYIAKILTKALSIFDTDGVDTFKDLENLKPEDVGLSQEFIDEVENINDDETLAVILICTLFLSALIFVILTFTSLHSLLKKRLGNNNSQMYNDTMYGDEQRYFQQ